MYLITHLHLIIGFLILLLPSFKIILEKLKITINFLLKNIFTKFYLTIFSACINYPKMKKIYIKL